MSRCRACGKPARTTTLALVLTERSPGTRQGFRGGRVCKACEREGVLVVAQRTVAMVVEAANARDAAKAERKGQREVLAPFIKNLEARLRAMRAVKPPQGLAEDIHLVGKLEAFEDMIAMLKEGRA